MANTEKYLPEYPELNDEPEFFTFKNDYIFTEVMKDKKVLKGFLMCLAGFEEHTIKNITILPRHLDKDTPVHKLGILDCRLELNDDSIINIELQILCFPHWDSRSLYYTCKMLTDQYHQGPKSYSNIKRCIHICILDFNFTDLEDDFYSVYKLRDEDHDLVYTDLLEIHVIQLKKREAPGVQKNYPRLYRWTQLFKIQSRKELENMTEQDEYIRAAAQAMDDLNLDAAHREAAFYRFLHLMDEQTMLTEQEELEMINASLREESESLKAESETLKAESDSLKRKSETLENQLDTALSQLCITLISILEQKFGTLSDSVLLKIRTEKDFSRLNDWLAKASLSASFSQFLEAVPELRE